MIALKRHVELILKSYIAFCKQLESELLLNFSGKVSENIQNQKITFLIIGKSVCMTKK